jgi:hypothetical protein
MNRQTDGRSVRDRERETDRQRDRQTERQTDMRGLIVAFCNFANFSKGLPDVITNESLNQTNLPHIHIALKSKNLGICALLRHYAS